MPESDNQSSPKRSPAGKPSAGDKRLIGPFQLEKQLGVGGMGIVYVATYTKTGQKVALKVLSPMLSSDEKLLARFEREMSILKKLKHPNIVKYYGGGKHNNQQYYAMELLTGGSLEDELKAKKKLPWERVVDIAMQICQALEHSHAMGIIHRDLKPANLFLGANGNIKLGDFGIARDTQDIALTAAGRTVGTYAYMAPEQIVGRPPVSRKTDLYALGCLMYELLTGNPPFMAENQADMFMMHLNDPPPSLRTYAVECPVWLESLIMRLLQKDPEERPYDALAVQGALDEVLQKVAEGESVARHTVSGQPSTVSVKTDKAELGKVLGRKKKKKKKQEPFYEKAWFLVACLAVLAGIVTWAVWPMSEKEMIAQIEAGMASENPEDWRATRDKFINDYLERFPESEYSVTANAHLDRINMYNTEQRLDRRDPENAYERLYKDAKNLEEFGDISSAIEQYQAITEVYGQEEDARLIVKLSQKRIEQLESSEGKDEDRTKPLISALQRAEKHFQEGKGLEARNIWRNLIKLYESKPEFAPQVKYAQARLENRDDVPFPAPKEEQQ